ncbi:MAG: hypothetical protein IKR73_05950 [Oscillospiraceae bacterium]|nr:hypothetical protein [Oscillospiraceae bacterium]
MNDRIMRIAAAAVMAVSIPSAVFSDAFAETTDDSVYHIASAGDLAEMAENCRLDSWSRGKRFVLDTDISLAPSDNVQIPSFSGAFDGAGHRISGVTIKGSDHGAGLFRNIEEEGKVFDLTVTGDICPSGFSESCGGIAGVNRGTISSCTFSGTVKGKSVMGGIVGTNEKTGMITGCTSGGTVQAEHYSGGIAGRSSGAVIGCTNGARVNTDALDITIGITSISNGDYSLKDITSAETVAAISDIGGIAGWSDGIISDCVNDADVGYMHTGYNIGGIVGRHVGYVSSCTNNGHINGRKDIGGIVGQAEPFTALIFSEDDTEKLKSDLAELREMIDTAIAHADTSVDDINAQSVRLTGKLDEIRTAADKYTDIADGIINENVETINDFSLRISELTERLTPFTEKLSSSADSFVSALESLGKAADIVEQSAGETDKALTILRPGMDEISGSIGSLRESVNGITVSLGELKAAMGDPEEFSRRCAELETDLTELKGRFDSISNACGDLITELQQSGEMTREKVRDVVDALAAVRDGANGVSFRIDDIKTKLRDLAEALRNGTDMDYRQALSDLIYEIHDRYDLQQMGQGFSDFVDSMAALIDEDAGQRIYDAAQRVSDEMHASADAADGTLTERLEQDRQRIQESADHIYTMIDTLLAAGADGEKAGVSAQQFINTVSEAWDYLDNSETELIDAVSMAEEAVSYGKDGVSLIKEGIDIIHDITEYFSGKAQLVFTGAGEDIVAARNEMSSLAGGFLDIMDDLTAVGGSSSDILTDDLVKINAKLSAVSDTLIDMTQSITERSLDVEDYTRDISLQETSGRTDGKTYRCLNYGAIDGDISVGGIAGTMAAENALDPEDDLRITGQRSLDFVYTTRTILSDCSSFAEIEAKRSNVGGVVGDMTGGCIRSCRARGSVKSAEGDYVGGIVGRSTATVLSSTAVCSLSGGNYIGGIAGEGHTITSCTAFTEILSRTDKYGSVAGYADDMDGDMFVDNGIGGCDGVSYDGRAYPVTYEQFRDTADKDMSDVVLRFVVRDDNGDIVSETACIDAGYGGSITDAELPQVPPKDGCYACWDSFGMEDIRFSRVIDAVYHRYITTISSSDTDENGRPRLMAEGSFDTEAKVELEQMGSSIIVSLPDDEDHVIRYLPMGDIDHTVIRIDGTAADTVKDGSYLVFTARGTGRGSFLLVEEREPVNIIPIAAAAAAAVVVLIVVVVLALKKK